MELSQIIEAIYARNVKEREERLAELQYTEDGDIPFLVSNVKIDARVELINLAETGELQNKPEFLKAYKELRDLYEELRHKRVELVPYFDLVHTHEVIESKRFESNGLTVELAKFKDEYFIFIFNQTGEEIGDIQSNDKSEKSLREIYNSLTSEKAQEELNRSRAEAELWYEELMRE